MMQRPIDRESMKPTIQRLKMDIDNWYTRMQGELNMQHQATTEKINAMRRQVLASDPNMASHGTRSTANKHQDVAPSGRPMPPSNILATPPRKSGPQATLDGDLENDWSVLTKEVMSTPPASVRNLAEITPTGSPQSTDKVPLDMLLSRISAGNNSPPLNFDSLYEQLAVDPNSPGMKGGELGSAALGSGNGASPPNKGSIPVDSLMRLQGQEHTHSLKLNPSDTGRPTVVSIPGGDSDDPARYDIDPNQKCEVLVEFKRKRVLQFHSNKFVGPGEYVVVGGDRGEDIGLVTYTWCETRDHKVKAIGLTGSSLTRSIGVGNGKVIRKAEPFEVSQLHGIQAELERRAVDVCQQRVIDHGIPMRIADAEYQFDKKKLTFFYESQQRLDFRELVRDLFKTFRARIWMELVEN